jgi:hypothetical protein
MLLVLTSECSHEMPANVTMAVAVHGAFEAWVCTTLRHSPGRCRGSRITCICGACCAMFASGHSSGFRICSAAVVQCVGQPRRPTRERPLGRNLALKRSRGRHTARLGPHPARRLCRGPLPRRRRHLRLLSRRAHLRLRRLHCRVSSNAMCCEPSMLVCSVECNTLYDASACRTDAH